MKLLLVYSYQLRRHFVQITFEIFISLLWVQGEQY